MISALTWIPQGAAQEFPSYSNLSDQDYEKITQQIQSQLHICASQKKTTPSSKTENDPELKELKEYHLSDYDDDSDENEEENEEQSNALFSNIKGLTFYKSNQEDPYIQLSEKEKNQVEEEEREEFRILPTDQLLLAAKTEDDLSHLEVYIYEEQEENLYVHHDILLPSFPLTIEWMNFNTSSPNEKGNYVAIGTFDSQIEVWNLDCLDTMYPDLILGADSLNSSMEDNKTEKKKKSKKNPSLVHTDAVLALSWNALAPSLLASGSADQTIKLWDLNSPQKALRSFSMHSDKVSCLVWHPSVASVLVSGGFDKQVHVFDTRSPDSQHHHRKVKADVECLAWNPHQQDQLFVSLDNGHVLCLDARNLSQPVFQLDAHDGPVSALSFCPQLPGALITGSADKTVKVWNIQNNKPTCVVSRDLGVGQVFSTCFARSSTENASPTLAVGGSKGNLVLWNLETNLGVREAFGLQGKKKTKQVKEILAVDSDGEIEDDNDEIEDAYEDVVEEEENEDLMQEEE